MNLIKKARPALKTLARIMRNFLFLRFKKGIRLNLGAGGTRMGTYINIDSLFMRETDVLCELKHLSRFIGKESATHIYASHILEHFSIGEVRNILKKSYHILEKGGEIRISVPDFDKITALYSAQKEEFKKKNPIAWLGVVYGGQSTKYDFHKTGFNAHLLKNLLEEAGFKNAQEYDAEKFLKQYNVKDSSLYKKDFGQYISLNMVAHK